MEADVVEVDAVLFDLDGTLVRSDAVVERCWRRWAAGVGLDPETFLDRVHGRIGRDVMAELLPGRPAAQDVADDEEMLRWECADTDGVAALPGARDLLASLDDARRAIVTACTAELASVRLAAAGLDRPRIMVTAEDVAVGKPAPDGYLAAARRLGVPPARCLVVEDAGAGVAAGRAAGMSVVGVGDRLGPHAAAPAHAWVASLQALTLDARPDGLRIALTAA